MIYSDNELSLKSFQSLKIDVPKFRNLKPPPLPHSPAPFPHQPLFSRLLHILLESPILPFPLHFLNLFPNSSISSITQSFFHPLHSSTLFLRFLSLLHFSCIILPTPLFFIPLFPFPSSFLNHYSSNSTIPHSFLFLLNPLFPSHPWFL